MTKDECLNKIERNLSKFFDIEKPYQYQNMNFDIYAKYHVRNEKYFASKKVTVYAFENNEFTLVKAYQTLDENNFQAFTAHLKDAALEFVQPDDEHMSTVMNGVILVENGIDQDIKKSIQKFKFMKSFKLGFKGWVYIRCIVIDLKSKEVITNKRGKEVESFYRI